MRASYGESGGVLDKGAPRSPLVPHCPYCIRLELLLVEGGAKFETVKIDVGERQQWYVTAFPPTDQTPGVYWPDASSLTGETADIRKRFVTEDAGVAKAYEARSPVSEDEIKEVSDMQLFSAVAPQIVGSEKGKGMTKFMLSSAIGGDAAEKLLSREEDREAAIEEAKAASREAFKNTLAKIAGWLNEAEARGGFLGGEKPDLPTCLSSSAYGASRRPSNRGSPTCRTQREDLARMVTRCSSGT